MTINYAIQPELNLLVYEFIGLVTADEYFKMYYAIYQDKFRHHGMKIIIDIRRSELDFSAQNLKEAVDLMRANRENQYDPDHVAILSHSNTLQLFAETLKLLSNDMPVYLNLFHNLPDAIRWLGLEDRETEVIDFLNAFYARP